MAPAVLEDTPGPGPQRKDATVDGTRILQNAVPDEVVRTILREALDRYRNELMDDEERQLLLDRIQRLRRKLGV